MRLGLSRKEPTRVTVVVGGGVRSEGRPAAL